MSTPNIKNLQEKNAVFSKNWTRGLLDLPPAKKVLFVTCMDARIDPVAQFGIQIGDAHVVRNAGGSAKDSIRSIVISQNLLGTREIIVVKHTDCGMLTFNNEEGHAIVVKNLGEQGDAALPFKDFLPLTDLEKDTIEDVEFLKNHPAVHKDIPITGWIITLETGAVHQVV